MRGPCLALLLVVLLASGCSEALDETFVTDGQGVLEVALDLGEGLRPDPGVLEVASHDSDEVRVLVDASGWGAYGVKFVMDHDERGVRVNGRVQGPATWLFGGPHLAVHIRVPRHFGVDLRSSSGEIRLEEIGGAVRARSDDAPIRIRGAASSVKLRTAGNVSVEDVAGDVDVRVRNATIEVSWVDGNVELRSSRGAIDVEHVDGHVFARSGRGGIEIRDVNGPVEAKTERGPVFASFVGAPAGSLETQRGSVEIVLPEGAGAQLDADSASGSLELAEGFRVNGMREDSRALGKLNGGGAELRLRTANGGIRVRRR